MIFHHRNRNIYQNSFASCIKLQSFFTNHTSARGIRSKEILNSCSFSKSANAFSNREHHSPLKNPLKLKLNSPHIERSRIDVKSHSSHLSSIRNINISSSAKNSSGNTSLVYKVRTIDSNGRAECQSMSYSDILKGSSIHVRDLFSLALTAVEEKKEHDSTSFVIPKDLSVNKIKRGRVVRNKPTPVILPRGEKIVISFGHVRAIIGNNDGMLFDAHDPNVKLFAEDLTNIIRNKSKENVGHLTDDKDPQSKRSEPFEIIFLEEVLKEACATWNRRILLYEPIVNEFISKVSNELYSESGVHRLVPIKDSLLNFEIQVKQASECLTDLLKNDEDMVGLLLTEQANEKRLFGKSIDLHRHVSVELLLEEYHRQLHHLVQDIQYLIRRVDSQQFLVTISLDTFRNRMIRTNLFMSVVAVSLASATTIAGLFGMNLTHGLEDSPTAFMTVCYVSAALGACVTLTCSWYLSTARLRKLTASKYTEIETINSTLNCDNGLDYISKVLQHRSDEELSVDYFHKLLKEADMNKGMTNRDIRFLFDMLDTTKNGLLRLEDDLPSLKK